MKIVLKANLLIVVAAVVYLSLKPKLNVDIGNDKTGHFIAYFALVCSSYFAFYSRSSNRLLLMGALSIIFGILIEMIQYFIPHRTFSWLDALANSGGVILGVIIIVLLKKPIDKVITRAGIID